MNCKSRFSLMVLLPLAFMLSHEMWGQQVKFNEKQVGNVYHVAIPDYMTKTYKLNDAASLQYLNAAKETYVIVIEDSKEQLLELGSPFQGPHEFLKHFENSFTDNSCQIGAPTDLKINGNPAVQVEITKPFGDYSVYYLVTVIESDTHFYKMLAWTIDYYRDQYRDDFKKIASSFKQ